MNFLAVQPVFLRSNPAPSPVCIFPQTQQMQTLPVGQSIFLPQQQFIAPQQQMISPVASGVANNRRNFFLISQINK